MADREIQNGGSLTVRESQMAVFVNEGKVADVFGPGATLTTQTLPILTYLKNWDKLFRARSRATSTSSARASRSTSAGARPSRSRSATGLRRGAPARVRQLRLPHRRPEAVPHRDLRHARPYTAADLDGQLRALMLQHISDAVASSGIAFLDLAANQVEFAKRCKDATAPAFEKIGLKLEA